MAQEDSPGNRSSSRSDHQQPSQVCPSSSPSPSSSSSSSAFCSSSFALSPSPPAGVVGPRHKPCHGSHDDSPGRLRLQHRRSTSWGGSGTVPPPSSNPSTVASTARKPPDPGKQHVIRLENSDSCSDAMLPDGLPPLHSLSVSQKRTSDRNKLINKIRNGTDMRLDLEAVERCGRDMDGDFELRQRKERMAECEKECSCILSYLFVGGRSVAQNLATLRNCRITHIINCVGFVCPEYFPLEFEYKTLWLHDSPNEDLCCILYDVFDYIENVREQSGGRVFVHCCQGVSRSAALAIAYIMWRKHETFEDAFHEVKLKRNVVSPNMGFAAQLMQWQSKILNPPDRHALNIYRITPHCAHDPLYLVPKMVIKPQLQALDSRGAFVIHLLNRLYLWKGRQCDRQMVKAADRVGFQLIRYEHAQGPLELVHEGKEPSQLLEMLKKLHQSIAGDAIKEKEVKLDKQNKQYDSDYELYRKAKVGGYVPPLLGSGVIIHIPARDEKWKMGVLNSPRQLSGKI